MRNKRGRDAAAARIAVVHHIGARPGQQDSYAISDAGNAGLRALKGVFCVVADGMGGMSGGAEISSLAARVMLEQFNETAPSGHPALDLLSMLHAANDAVNGYLKGRERGGTTVVAVIILNDELHFISAGDSRIYLLRGGALWQLNREHNYGVDLDEMAASGKITWEDAAGDPQRSALTSFLGVGELERLDRSVRPIRLVPGDRVALMSDGVFGFLPEGEMLDALAMPLDMAAESLKNRVLARNHPAQDNFTAVIIEHGG